MLSAVESQIPRELKARIVGGFRYVDDFFLCFAHMADADAVLAALREAALHYDLQLNANKTHTLQALSYNEESWPSDISAIRIELGGTEQRRSLLRYFSTVIRVAKASPDESVANYAIRKTARIKIDTENWDLYEAFLLRISREYTNCIDSVVKIICTYAAIGHPITPSVSQFVHRIIEDHAPYNHHFEVAWALWLARSLQVRLSASAASLVLRIENDVCAILAMHLRGRRLLAGRKHVSSWISNVTKDDLLGPHWLLIYEAALRSGWPINGASTAVESHEFFAALKAEKISFFNSRAYNRPLKIPGMEWELRSALNGRRRALLPGAVMVASQPNDEENEFEELGGDYGESDVGDGPVLPENQDFDFGF